jgi:hypothetical protein
MEQALLSKGIHLTSPEAEVVTDGIRQAKSVLWSLMLAYDGGNIDDPALVVDLSRVCIDLLTGALAGLDGSSES